MFCPQIGLCFSRMQHSIATATELRPWTEENISLIFTENNCALAWYYCSVWHILANATRLVWKTLTCPSLHPMLFHLDSLSQFFSPSKLSFDKLFGCRPLIFFMPDLHILKWPYCALKHTDRSTLNDPSPSPVWLATLISLNLTVVSRQFFPMIC